MAETYKYTPFGAVERTGSVGNTFTYTGREWDEEAGLYYYRARYYDPEVGRFIGKDPIGFAGGDVNLYGYVLNNPGNWVDPDGFRRQEGKTPPRSWPQLPRNVGGKKPKWNPNGYWDGKKGRRLTWDPHAHGAGVDRGQGPQDGHWDDETSGERWDRYGNPLGKKSEYCSIPEIATGAGVVVGGYLIYRGIRMIPSLFPPLWWTIPINAATP